VHQASMTQLSVVLSKSSVILPSFFFGSFDRVVAKISAIEKDAGLNLPMGDNEEISKVSENPSLLDSLPLSGSNGSVGKRNVRELKLV
jgi:hypothetical protein